MSSLDSGRFWRGLKLVVADGYRPEVPAPWQLAYWSEAPAGSAKTFMEVLRSAVRLAPGLRRLTYFQDDVVISKDGLTYIDRLSIDDDLAFVSWFSFWENWKGSLVFPLLEIGKCESFIASLGLTLTRQTVDGLLEKLEAGCWKHRNASDRLFNKFMPEGLFAAHYPVIVQHTEGNNSACSPHCIRERKSSEFVGEGFDALSLIHQ